LQAAGGQAKGSAYCCPQMVQIAQSPSAAGLLLLRCMSSSSSSSSSSCAGGAGESLWLGCGVRWDQQLALAPESQLMDAPLLLLLLLLLFAFVWFSFFWFSLTSVWLKRITCVITERL